MTSICLRIPGGLARAGRRSSHRSFFPFFRASTLVSDANLLKFLNWKLDVTRAVDRFHAFRTWTRENPWAFEDLQATKDPRLRTLLASNILIAPPSLVAKNGAAVLVTRLRNNDMSDGRTPQDVCRSILYQIDRVLERQQAQTHGCILFHQHDVLHLFPLRLRL